MLTKEIQENYIKILQEELIPAFGCTEPIALAYAAARGIEVLGCLPTSVNVSVCGNIIKNVQAVVVPSTGGMKGVDVAVAAGIVAGSTTKQLELLSTLTPEDIVSIKHLLASIPFEVTVAECDDKTLYIKITLTSANDVVSVTTEDYHSNIVSVERNGRILHKCERFGTSSTTLADRSCLTIENIVEFVTNADLTPLTELIDRQIRYNTAISNEGLTNHWGAEIGRVISRTGNDTATRAKAAAAAGSDARMSGCELPVVVVSGSGNQGMTASLPVIEYARALGSTKQQLLRALVLSNLVTIEQKTGIGRLSAYCGAVSAGCGAAAAICFLHGGGFIQIAHTIVNTLAISSGIICDGAKPSCAAKIAIAVESGLLGYRMYLAGKEFKAGEGIVAKGVDNTIANVGQLARQGMKNTDKEILSIMTSKKK